MTWAGQWEEMFLTSLRDVGGRAVRVPMALDPKPTYTQIHVIRLEVGVGHVTLFVVALVRLTHHTRTDSLFWWCRDMSLQERLERYKSVKEARMAAKLKEKKVRH